MSYLGSQDLSGRRAAGSSKWAAGATIESAVPFAGTPESPIDFFVGANWSYRSNFYAAVNLDPFSKVPGYHLIGLNLGVRNQRNWELSFWVRNLLDTNFYSTISVNQTYGITQVSVGEPRLFGFTLRGNLTRPIPTRASTGTRSGAGKVRRSSSTPSAFCRRRTWP